MKTLILLLFFSFILPLGIFASDFDNAKKAYEQGNYKKAAKLYQKLVMGNMQLGLAFLELYIVPLLGLCITLDKA